MHLVGTDLRLSPSDLSGFLGCRHLTGLDLAVAHGLLPKPVQNDAVLEAMRRRGAEHEQAYVDSLRANGLAVVAIPTTNADIAARAAATLQAMRDGAQVIVQATLVSHEPCTRGTRSTLGTLGTWLGYADVLRRVNRPSNFGAWSYEPVDTKLARETRGGTILQLAVYADLLEQLQGLCPEQFHVVTPGTNGAAFIEHAYRFNDYAAYYRVVRAQLAETIALGHEAIRDRHYPEPVEHCDVCRWSDRCTGRRRADDHLSFIAGIGRLHRDELTAHGVPTLAAAAAMPLPIAFTPARGSAPNPNGCCG
jgi:predicted RecB family nuclease